MLTIENMKWPHQDFKQYGELIKVLSGRLSKHNILVSMSAKNDTIVFSPISGQGKRIAISKVKNMIPLKAGDPRIERKGRAFLETERITKAQDEAFFSVINKTLDELQVSAKVTLGTDKSYLLRDGNVKNATPVLKSYPVAKTGV